MTIETRTTVIVHCDEPGCFKAWTQASIPTREVLDRLGWEVIPPTVDEVLKAEPGYPAKIRHRCPEHRRPTSER